jgi:hypothetical protein
MKRHSLLRQAQRGEQNYAKAWITLSNYLAQEEVYHHMAQFSFSVRKALVERYCISEQRPIVHIDIGSGTGAFLATLSAYYTAAKIQHCLIGVEINDTLARYSVELLQKCDRFSVGAHIHRSTRESHANGATNLQYDYPLLADVMNNLEVTPGKRIIVLQDDARRDLQILFAVLEKLRKQGFSHVDAVSYGLWGSASDLFAQDRASKEHSAPLVKAASSVVQDTTKRTIELAEQVLPPHGSLQFYKRMFTDRKLEELYRRMTGKEFPTDENEGVIERVYLSMATAGVDFKKFDPHLGSVLITNFEEFEEEFNAEQDFCIEIVDTSTPENTEDPLGPSYDLFAMSVVPKS